jgi:hypothetical protein
LKFILLRLNVLQHVGMLVSNVTGDVVLLGGGERTYGAFEGFLARMNPHVALEMPRCPTLHVASFHGTLVWRAVHTLKKELKVVIR